MSFSVGILYSAQEFLRFVTQVPTIDLSFPELFQSFLVASPTAVLELSQSCGWVQLSVTGQLELTEKGRAIIETKQAELALRIQPGDIIETTLPKWIPLLSRGRAEASKYLHPDIAQCFREANLFDRATDDIVNWWDRYSKVSRKSRKDSNLEVGRQGEKLSLEYERKRTKREPVWQGFESNLAGFDILSVVSENNPTSLRIEVKTSNSKPDTGSLYITRNEWTVATTTDQYQCYLWSLLPKPSLMIVSVEQVAMHVSSDQGDGEWQRVLIPFSAFISS